MSCRLSSFLTVEYLHIVGWLSPGTPSLLNQGTSIPSIIFFLCHSCPHFVVSLMLLPICCLPAASPLFYFELLNLIECLPNNTPCLVYICLFCCISIPFVSFNIGCGFWVLHMVSLGIVVVVRFSFCLLPCYWVMFRFSFIYDFLLFKYIFLLLN